MVCLALRTQGENEIRSRFSYHGSFWIGNPFGKRFTVKKIHREDGAAHLCKGHLLNASVL